MRFAERLPRCRAAGRGGVQPGRGHGVGERRRRPARARARRRRSARARPAPPALARRAPRSPWLGKRLHDGARDPNAPLRRPLHPGGAGSTPVTDADILEPSEAFRKHMDYYAHAPTTAATLERLAKEQPRTLACMHGSAWRGDGAVMLRA